MVSAALASLNAHAPATAASVPANGFASSATTEALNGAAASGVGSLPPSLTPNGQAGGVDKQAVAQALASRDVLFESNVGQIDGPAQFLVKGQAYDFFINGPESRFVFTSAPSGSPDVLTMQLVGANAGARAEGQDQVAAKTNYLLGNDPSRWHTDVPNYAQVTIAGVYSGINEVFHSNAQHELEYDFTVDPHVSPDVIRMHFDGATGTEIGPDGALVLHTASGVAFQQQAPAAYQVIDGVRREVSAGFVLEANGEVGFTLGRYDPNAPVVIDPIAPPPWSTYLGGTSTDRIYAVAADSTGVYVTGYTGSPNFPTHGAYQGTLSGTTDAFVTKLDLGLSTVLYSTYFGGTGADYGNAIVVKNGNAYVVGTTWSNDLPTTVNAFQPGPRAAGRTDSDAFAVELKTDGSGLEFGTYLGGTGDDAGYGVALDTSNNVYVTGWTKSNDFPTTAGAFQTGPRAAGRTDKDAFVTKLFGDGTALSYSTYLGGAADDEGRAIAVAGGVAYVTGYTTSNNFPTKNARQGALSGTSDAFVTAVKQDGSGLIYSTYHGGAGGETGYGIAASSDGSAFVTGYTTSNNFPTTANAAQVNSGGGTDAFVSKFDNTGQLSYSTYLGGTDADFGMAIAIDAAGLAYVTGYTQSTNFPLNKDAQIQLAGGKDAFLTRVSAAGDAFTLSTYWGGSGDDFGQGVAVVGTSPIIAGYTNSVDFPNSTGYQRQNGGGMDGFLAAGF
jgi:Beta-propeller repeat